MTDPLRQYAHRRDAEAFRMLVEHYQGLVYSAASRRLERQQDIEDVVQTTFLKLARAAGTIRRDLAAWLYSTAINTANELIRRDATRERHEARAREHAAAKNPPEEREWQAISLIVDEAMLELPPAGQSLLVEHFFRGRSQRELAAELRVSQSTVTRRLRDAVEALRGLLATRGVTADSPRVETTLWSLAALAVPAALSGELAKIGLVGIASSAPAGLGITGLGAKISWVAAGLVVAGGAVIIGAKIRASAVASAAPPKQAVVAPLQPAVAVTIPATSAAPADMKVRDVVALSKATLSRFQYLEVNFTQFHFKYQGDELAKEPTETDVITSRKSPNQQFYESNFSVIDRGVLSRGAHKDIFGPTYAKTLDTYDEQNLTQHVGRIFTTVNGVAGAKVSSDTSTDLLATMWYPWWWDRMSSWEGKSTLDRTKLTRDAASGLITLTSDADARATVAITVDPAKGYEPTAIAIHNVPDGTIWKFTFSDFREVDKGLWLPYQWTTDLPGTQLSKFAIQSAKLNVPFKPEELDFDFPPDAGITDENHKILSRQPGPGEWMDADTGVIERRPGH